MTRYGLGRRHEEKVMNRYRKYPRIHSARSAKVDVVIFSVNGVTKLVECKRCSSDAIYLYPNDLHHLYHFYTRLVQLGHSPQMVLSLWFPKRKLTREVNLDPEMLSQNRPLKFELTKNRRIRFTCLNSLPRDPKVL